MTDICQQIPICVPIIDEATEVMMLRLAMISVRSVHCVHKQAHEQLSLSKEGNYMTILEMPCTISAWSRNHQIAGNQ